MSIRKVGFRNCTYTLKPHKWGSGPSGGDGEAEDSVFEGAFPGEEAGQQAVTGEPDGWKHGREHVEAHVYRKKPEVGARVRQDVVTFLRLLRAIPRQSPHP